MIYPPGFVYARDHEGRDTGGGRCHYHAEGDNGADTIVDWDEELGVVKFDGSARVKRGGGAFSAIGLPGWEVGKARSSYLESLTVNEAEYNGLTLGLDMLEGLDHKRLVVCGDSNLGIREKRKALDRLRKWSDHELVHVKRDWNGSADSLASAALQRKGGIEVQRGPGYQDLVALNRLDEILIPRTENPVVRVAAVTTRAARVRSSAGVMQEDLIREMRVDRIKQAHEEEVWIAGMKKYLSGSTADLTHAEAISYRKIAADYEVDEQDLLFYCPTTPRSGDDRDLLLRLVVPETLQSILHHYHTTLEGGHQGVGHTYQRIRDHFHWRGLYRSLQRYVGECVDCETGKGKPVIRGESPGNLQGAYPFQIIAMDHIPSLPRPHKGNTETAQTVAESYEECVFRRFGASEMIRHDREPGFMSDFFRAFNKILGQRQRATMAYRPQANGTAERMVQAATRALMMYVRDLDQKDWDEYAERLTFAINTAHYRIRGDTPHYLVHGWDPRSTLEATLSVGCTRQRDRDARRWRYRVQRYYQQSREQVNAILKEAIADRAGRHKEDVGPHKIEAGSNVWLYLDRVKEGYARKLAHLSHGPFWVAEKINEFSIRLEIAGTGYQIFPIVHVSKLKLVKDFPDRQRMELTVDESDRLDFEEILLPEDSWVRSRSRRVRRRTYLGCAEWEENVIRSDLPKIPGALGYDELTWVDEANLKCGAILIAFLRERANRNRFNVMQLHEEI
ncbi:LOW QUALITY PROTEIN: reverse transcriptase [Phytophthora megakarya]|uniref:Reverse transcriptase n=1 Tax=Phytophthora megakarya TaxID=4795 RepID=A0A225WAL8_9STRA|nr:LOW QUALITY PROTEIN: reverse transcriptase [Phytophthora megakarya]